ncbi:outer membrane protein [Bradyrhizobium arachidis]|uniref:outer membrane protein n=1 Tax=Bradyrhizobium arachidis TaxID=858423 RepID=UPI002161D454|nr:outer membrane beta-barrel protein [Bradyrhizobium arachidis]
MTACVGVVLALALPGTGSAADLAVKAPILKAAAPVPFTWTGCYVGGHVGGVVSDDRTTGVLGNSVSFSSAGFVGGGQIGCDYQFTSSWVVGVEGRAAWTSLSNSHAGIVRNLVTGAVLPSQFTMSNDMLASATVRLGYAVAERWLVFVRGGAAWTREKIDDAFTPPAGPVDPSATTTATGWTAGTGVDWAFAPHWSAVFEYDYYDFGNRSVLLSNGAGSNVNIFSLKDRIHAVTAGVNYHF